MLRKDVKPCFLILIFVAIFHQQQVWTVSYHDRVIGCLFGKVCEENQVCFDDNAFGRCEEFDSQFGSFSSTYVYQLDRKTIQLLEKELDRLSLEDFTWSDTYTQCVLKSILNERPRTNYDAFKCQKYKKKNLQQENIEDYSTDDPVFQSILFSADPLPENFFPTQNRKSKTDLSKEMIKSSLREKHLKKNADQPKAASDVDLNDGLLMVSDQTDNEPNFNKMKLYLKSMIAKNAPYFLSMKENDDRQSNIEDIANDDQANELRESFNNDQLQQDKNLEFSSNPFGSPVQSKVRVLRQLDQNTPKELIDSNESLDSQSSLEKLFLVDFNRKQPTIENNDDSLSEFLSKQINDYDDFEEENFQQPEQEQFDGYIDDENKPTSFYRNHRYDIKKPGPKFFEEYIFKNNQNESKNIATMKKDINIRSHKPVLEGPVKVDSQSSDTLIIRSAEQNELTNLEAIDSTHTYIVIDRSLGEEESEKFVETLEQVFKLPRGTFSNLKKEDSQITFKVNPNYLELNASQVALKLENLAKSIEKMTGYQVKETGIGDTIKLPVISTSLIKNTKEKWINLSLLVCSMVLGIFSAVLVISVCRKNIKFRDKIKNLMKVSEEWSNFDYQQLCRQRMQGTKEAKQKQKINEEKPSADHVAPENQTSPPSRSSTSSTWVEEPVVPVMDITTGHIILSYMEDHLKNKNRLNKEWDALCNYETDLCSTNAALLEQNLSKNRYRDVLPYDHSRVILNDFSNASHSDYINGNTITDHDPRNPAYIATQGPLFNTIEDFWQMIWEQGSVIIVMLTRLRENGLTFSERYWPEEAGSETYQNYEVHLVSEHIWTDDYLVRSFYLKNLKSGETRTVSQFHYLSWPENGIPPNTKSLLDFRRKVNKSYKGRSCPIVIHCNDGISRTGTYILIDMVLNRLSKGAKEIDLVATLEHIRDQRCSMVKNKTQFEFVLLAIADEVQAILKALPSQN